MSGQFPNVDPALLGSREFYLLQASPCRTKWWTQA